MKKSDIYETLKDKHRKDNEKITSQSISTRLFIIESTIYIEELISGVLGLLLGFDSKSSKSLGTKSSAISFNQKVTLIQDIECVSKCMINKMKRLMEIRNKFAHVSEINNFKDLKCLSNSGIDILKDLKKWYASESNLDEVNEEEYINLFNKLREDIINFLFKLTGDFFYNYAFEEGRSAFKEKLLENLIKEIYNKEGGKEQLNRIMDKAKKDSITD